MHPDETTEVLQMRVHGDAALPTLIYLPGTHGDWTLITGFRKAVGGHLRFVEFTYPRTLTWSLEEYADAIEAKLLEHGILHGWLLGESFGSQIAWPLATPGRRFRADGIILAGGFVKHPFRWGVCRARDVCHGIPLIWLTRLLFGYAKFARFRHRHSPELSAGVAEFMARRTALDKQAATHRLRLIAANDPRSIVSQLTTPVYYLSGWFDIVVPWPWVRHWLKNHCPAYRGDKIIWRSEHTVLATAPKESAQQAGEWVREIPAANTG